MKKKLFIATLVSYLGIYITMPILSAISTKAHMNPSKIGIMISLGAFAMLLFAPLWGKLSDVYGRKIVMVSGLLGMGLLFVLYTFLFKLSVNATKITTLGLAGLMGTRFLLGIFMTTTPTAANAYMADISSPSERAKDMSSLGAATGLAMVAGPIIGGILSSSGNLFIPFYVTILLLIIMSFVFLGVLPNTERRENESSTKPDRIKHRFFSLKLFGWLFAGLSVMFVVVGLQLLTSLYLHDKIGETVVASAKSASILFVVLGVTLMLIQILQMKFLKWTAAKMMTIAIPLIVLGLMLIVLTSSYFTLVVAYVSVGAGAGLGISSLSAGASLSVSQDQQGTVAGAVAMTQGLAGIVSPLLGSFLYQVNNELPFIFFSFVSIVAYIIFILVIKKNA